MASAVVDNIWTEENALEILYATFAEPLRKFCRGRLEGRQDEAEDACHETLLRASKALPSFRAGEPLWPWLATIAANVCKDMTRNDRRFGGEIDADTPDPAGAPEDEVDRRSRADIVVAAMGAVPLHYRKALYLREWEDLSWADIARMEGKSVASVRSTLMRARRVLRSSIREEAERVHQWPLPTITPPRDWGRPFARFRERLAQWYPSAPERALALLPVPAVEWVSGMLAGGGAAVAQGGVALLLSIGVAGGAGADVALPPGGQSLGPSGERTVNVSGSAGLAAGGGSVGASGTAEVKVPPIDDWWRRRQPDAIVPVASGEVNVVVNPMKWGEPGYDGREVYTGPGVAVIVEPPKETGLSQTGYVKNSPASYCSPEDRRTQVKDLECDGLKATTQF